MEEGNDSMNIKKPEALIISQEISVEETLSNSVDSKSVERGTSDPAVKEAQLLQSAADNYSPDSQNETGSSSSELFDKENVENCIVNGDLINEYNILKEQNKSLKEGVQNLEKTIAKLEADRSPELHALQLETLEKTIQQQRLEILRLQDSIRQKTEIFHKQMNEVKQECDFKYEKLSKQYEIANKERESMVMKYAVSEKSVIDLRREIQSYDHKITEILKEKDGMQARLKAVMAEKVKMNQALEIKISEIQGLERENSKRKDEIHIRDSKIKWAQNRLKSEMDSHIETQGKLEKLQQKFNEVKEEAEHHKKQNQALIRTYQVAQEDKANQEQEQKAKLIIDKHDEETAAKLQLELDNYKKKQQTLLDENNHLNFKIQNLEKERLEYEQNLTKMKQCVDAERQVVVDLQSQITELESSSLLLRREQERLEACQIEMEKLRLANVELQQEMDSCRNREAESLEFTQNLTEKNVRLQSEFTSIEARIQMLEMEHNSCTREISRLTNENITLKEELEREKSLRTEEKELLSRHLAEETRKTETLAQELADQQGENQLLKKKHLITLKELTKELQVCRKKLERYEKSQETNAVDGSRASSSTSLNVVETSENKTSNSQPLPTTASVFLSEPDRQVLIDKIVKIQRSNARKTEKIEFLEEHVRQLVAELQKKTRIIQNYIIREQSGALSSETMDQNKITLSKHGGIMASVYNSKPIDEGMTLELSLEINQKLQAVLEDTLLKNITLKENMETLGNEIERLTSCHQPKLSF